MLPPQTVGIKLGPGGVKLLQLFLDEGPILRGAAVLQLLALSLYLSYLGLDGGKRALQLLKSPRNIDGGISSYKISNILGM